MDLILCSIPADFDTLGAAIGLTHLWPGAPIVLAADPAGHDFWALHCQEYALIEWRSVHPDLIRNLVVVGAAARDRLGPTAAWLDRPQIKITRYDRSHWPPDRLPPSPTGNCGAITTLVVEHLQARQLTIPATTATTMALGIHAATDSLTAAQTTSRDGAALAWLMQQGADHTIAAARPGGSGQPLTAQALMSAPVRTICPDTTIATAQHLLLRYGHSGLAIVDAQEQLIGIITRRDLDIAAHHGFGQALVQDHMMTQLKPITPATSLSAIHALMVTYDIGQLPVLAAGQLVGIVTRTDVLRHLPRTQSASTTPNSALDPAANGQLTDRLAPSLQAILAIAAQQAEQNGWQLYLVGGAVRDLWLAAPGAPVMLTDIDLVVDGYDRTAAAGVALARSLQSLYPQARLEIHGKFQTAALLWHQDPSLASLWIDIATARTEFYPYPAANPEVAASSIQQDLYRRDFTINALALCLTNPNRGQLLDFFGGRLDLSAQQIRVLHANSFIEDPTRIYRAVRFAVRLGFTLEPQTASLMRYAIASGIYATLQQRAISEQLAVPALQSRLKSELKYLLQAPYWLKALRCLANLGALKCIHVHLELDAALWRQMRLVDRGWRHLDPHPALPPWLMRLETLIAALAPAERVVVGQMLQLPVASTTRLAQLTTAQADILVALPQCDRPSQVIHQLRPYDFPLLLLVAARCDRATRRQIWQYLTRWSQIKPLIDGQALKALGYQPGKLFKRILADLLTATVDGVVGDRAAAEAWLSSRYPRRSEGMGEGRKI